jgi:hypothetical protein
MPAKQHVMDKPGVAKALTVVTTGQRILTCTRFEPRTDPAAGIRLR